MTHKDLEPLPGDVETLIEAERRAPGAPRDAQARVLARVRATTTIPPAPPASARPWSELLSRPAPWVVATLALGVAIGAGLTLVSSRTDRSLDPRPSPPPAAPQVPAAPEDPAALRDSATPRVSTARLTPQEPTPGSGAAASRRAPARVRPEPPQHQATMRNTLAAESALLRMARSRLADGDGPAALDALDQHACEFPQGILAEEREALAVKALASTGDFEAAHARGARFGRRYRESIYLPVVKRALESIP